MAVEAYPVGVNSGFSEESAIDSERDRLVAALGGRMSDFIVDPFTAGHFDESHSGSSLDITIDTGGDGLAFLNGHLIENDGTSITLTLDASATNEIFLVLVDGEPGNAYITYTSDGSTPTGQAVMKLWEATTDSSGVTGTTDFRKYTPFEDGAAPEDSVTGRKTGTSGTIDISSTGIKTVDVTFQNPYRVSLDEAVAQPGNISDTAVALAYWRTTNLTTDGFTIEARVDKAGGSGSTADFDWFTQGK